MAADQIETKILRLELEGDPAAVIPHPSNARLHPPAQKAAMDESLGRLGWIDAVIVNERTSHVLDGHDRVEEALERGTTVPLMWVDVAEEDEEFVLATFDPIAALAEWDPVKLGGLVENVELETEALRNLLTDQLALVVGPPPLEDLADEYDPDAAGHGDSGSEWLRLEVGEEALALWRSHREGHASDDEALRELLT